MGQEPVDDVLERFSAPTRDWFRGAFERPTAAQEGAWRAVSSGDHALVVAPTGSGKTLSAFLWALDRLAVQGPPEDPLRRTRVVYVSPLKALATDVERNLRSPLLGIGYAAQRLGAPVPEVSVAIRSGDTPADERRAFTRRPPDVLITTPESLFLLLTSKAREVLGGVETVILDEVHAVAGTKRGAHLALTLERLDALLEAGGGQPAQRIGLSATVRPVEEVARFLSGARAIGAGPSEGGRPVTIVQPASTKSWDLSVVVAVPDMGELGQRSEEDLSGLAAGEPQRRSIWPAVEERVVDLVAAHRSTIVFANSRRVAERLTTRLNEVWAERNAPDPEAEGETPDDDAGHRLAARRTPAEVMAQAGQSKGLPVDAPVLARAHHGSVSREQRTLIEEDLKAGRLPAVVATSSLELGIDMGAVDLVVQVGSPPSVASGLQRVGRAGHQVGATSRGGPVPPAPQRPRPDRRRHRAHAHRRHRGAQGPGEPARRPRPAGGGDHRPRRGHRRRARAPRPPRRSLLGADPGGAGGRARHARGSLPQRGVRRAATAHRVGPHHRRPHRPPWRPAPGGHQWRHHPRPRPVRRLPRLRRGPPAAASASSTRRWSTSRASATSSPSAPPRGASRTSPTTACSSPPPPACPASCRSGTARPWAAPTSWAAPSAPSPARWGRCWATGATTTPAASGRWPRAWTSGPPTTSTPT
ncbi:MAG: DEAD/DEAH box helicase [Quadrisphaera sp.]